MIKLTPQSVAQAALKAWAEGRLGFQVAADLDGYRTPCRYRYDEVPGACCAIGAALPDGLADRVKGGIIRLKARGCVTFDDEDEAILQEIQTRHDELARLAAKPSRRNHSMLEAKTSLFRTRLEQLAA